MKSLSGIIVVLVFISLTVGGSVLAAAISQAEPAAPQGTAVPTTREPASPVPLAADPMALAPTATAARTRGRNVAQARSTRHVSNRNVVVIPGTQVKAEDFEQTMEDMRVMLYILEGRFREEPSLIYGLFQDYGDFFNRDRQAAKAVYIQDYGVVFLMEVDFPLVFPPEPQQQQAQQGSGQEDADPIWRQARDELLAQGVSGEGIFSNTRAETIQQRAERLRTDLIKTLKHASNIRHVKPDEYVILTMMGWHQAGGGTASSGQPQPPTGGMAASTGRGGGGFAGGGYGGGGGGSGGGGFAAGGYGGGMMGGGGGGYGGGMYVGGSGGYGGGMGGGYSGAGFALPGGAVSTPGFLSSAVLTIRTKKSDVDALAKGELDYDQFSEKVQIFTY